MSEFFDWDAAKYGLNIPQVDEEHQQIISAMNELHRMHLANQPVARLGEALHHLQRVTVAHFRAEEKYMEQIGYADLIKHRQVHERLLGRLDAFANEFRVSKVLTEEFFLFLKMWLKSHICGIDTQYAAQVHAA